MRVFLLFFLLSAYGLTQAADCPQGSRVIVKTQPAKAEVYLEGQKLADESPVITPPLCVGRYRLEVKAAGYDPKQETVEIQVADTLITKTIVIEKPKPQLAAIFRDSTTGLELALIPKGCFEMGSPANEKDRSDDEGPQHQVCFDQPFYLGKTEVTQAQWEAVMGSNPSYFKGANLPVENVSWDDIQAFIRKLNAQTGKHYRLPSEAEWEYAARAGSTTAYPWGNTASHEYANYGTDTCCSGLAQGRDRWEKTSPVGSFAANAFGLYDMQGNVWEWVQDIYHSSYASAPTDGSAWQTSGSDSRRVSRGGSWRHRPRYLRAARRDWGGPGDRGNGLGFRLAASSQGL